VIGIDYGIEESLSRYGRFSPEIREKIIWAVNRTPDHFGVPEPAVISELL
jgi:hypothetical protein